MKQRMVMESKLIIKSNISNKKYELN